MALFSAIGLSISRANKTLMMSVHRVGNVCGSCEESDETRERRPSRSRAMIERASSDLRAMVERLPLKGRARAERRSSARRSMLTICMDTRMVAHCSGERVRTVRKVFVTPTRPDPTPITTPKGVVPRKRGTRIPDQFVVTREMRDWAADRTPLVNVDDATERFVNYWRAKAGRDATKLDWPATWRNWLIKDQDDRHNRKLTPTERAAQTATAGRQVAGRQITSLDPKEVTA